MFQKCVPFVAEKCSMVWMYHYLFNNSPVEGYLGCFQFGAIIDKGAVNIHV